MHLKRPDVSDVAPEVLAYIEMLEAEVSRLRDQRLPAEQPEEAPAPEPSEPPTPVNVITISAGGLAKRTPRHHYTRQRRGGRGVFDLDTPEDDLITVLALADEAAMLVVFTDRGRTYRVPTRRIREAPVRAKGSPLHDVLPLRPDERVVAVLPADAGESVALVGARGWISTVRNSFLSRNMTPGVSYYDAEARGRLVAACWLPSDDHDVLIATRRGQAIRFAARRVPKGGCLGIRLDRDDAVTTIAAVDDDTGVFLLGADGKGTIRLMQGFRANKSPGGGGKIAMKTEHLVDAAPVAQEDDIFVISHYSKIIRFTAAEVPPKTSPVQGVNCISLRGDEAVALAIATL
jgi:DNA gyrase subunit A